MGNFRLFYIAALALFLASCDHPYILNNSFVEDVDGAVARVAVDSVSPANCAPEHACVASVSLKNDRSLAIVYDVESSDESLSGTPSVVSAGPERLLFSFTPTAAADGQTLSFTVSMRVAENGRHLAPVTLSIPCSSAILPTWLLTYDANGGTGTLPANSGSYYPDGTTVTVGSAGSLAYAGHLFSIWNTAIDGSGINYDEGDSVVMTGNVTLYAQWFPSAAITFNQNGGTGIIVSAIDVISGQPTGISNAGNGMTKDGQTLTGWNTAADGTGTPYALDATITTSVDLTLYAQWSNTSLLALLANISSGGDFALSGDLTDAEFADLRNAVYSATAPVTLDLSGLTTYALSENLFVGCTELTSVILPNNLMTLPQYCFWNCTALTSLTLNDGLQIIDANCIKGCTALTELTIPDSVCILKPACFDGSGLDGNTGVITFLQSDYMTYYDTETPAWTFGSSSQDIFGCYASPASTYTFTIKVPASAESGYESLPLMSRYADRIIGY